MRSSTSLAVPLLAIAACATRTPAPADPRPLVAVSVVPQKFFVDRLAGGTVRVEVLIPPGANPHSFEPSFDAVRALDEARLYVRVGHPAFAFEQAWIDRLLGERNDLIVVDTGGDDANGDGGDGGDGESHDGHSHAHEEDGNVWLDPERARAMARAIADALRELQPGRAGDLDAALARLEAEIDAASEEVRGVLAPHRGERFLVFHPSWGHLARAFGLRQVAIEREGKEPDAHGLAGTIAAARAARVTVVFAQPGHPTAAAEVVAAEAGAKVELLDPLAYDWTSNLKAAAQAIAAGSRP